MSFLPKWASLAVGRASIALMLGPGSASANVAPPEVVGNKLTVKGDNANDAITLTVVAGKLAVNGAATTLNADANAEIVVEAGGGNDTVDASALAATNYKSIVESGGEGEDTLTGGNGADKLVGDKGKDTANGRAGNDTMVWNNGDASDVNNGEAGDDTVVVNGSPSAETGDVDTFKPENAADPNDVRVVFARTNLVAFTVNFDAEHLVINGLAGNDEITGSDGNDILEGGSGNDKLVGFKGNDLVNGGEGDDLMVWNNGDGSDEDIGEGGVDTVESNGAASAENYTFKASARAGWVRFDRAPNGEGKGAFFIEFIESEKFVVNALGGDDHLESVEGGAGLKDLTSITINAGEGNDTVVGGDGNDAINGEEGNDKLTGGKGGDAVAGGAGDDTMTWNNGDASDVNNGEAGDDEVVVNGSPAAGDAFTYKPVDAADNANVRVLFARTNLVAFTINFDAERLTVNGLGGNDTMAPDAASPTGLATRTKLLLDGGEGNDTLVGGDGNDAILGGAGSDTLDGLGGDDQLVSRDGENDLVRGGDGEDSAQTDELTVDSVNGVEHVDATPAAPQDTDAQLPRLGKTTVAGKGNSLTAMVPVSCPATEKGGCRTTLTLETAKPARVGGLRAIVVLGSKSVKLAAGGRTNAAIRIAHGAGVLARRGKLPAKIRIVSSDAAGNTATRTVAVTLKISR